MTALYDTDDERDFSYMRKLPAYILPFYRHLPYWDSLLPSLSFPRFVYNSHGIKSTSYTN